MGLIGYGILLLIIAALVALAARRLHVPYTVGLVIAGIGLALTHINIGISLTPQFVLDILLPPLLFEASMNLHWKELRRDFLPIFTLSTIGVLIAAVVTSVGSKYLLGWPRKSSILFAILIAATDPVAVIALFKDIGITGRLRLLVESESLFNDGVVAVLFALALAWTQSQTVALLTLSQSFVTILGGALLAGGLCSLVTIFLSRHTEDHLVETALTAITAYGSFIFAQSIGASGILATVVAGLIVGNVGVLASDTSGPLSATGRAFVVSFWEFAAFLANSIIFLLIGLRVAVVPFASFGWTALFWIIVITLGARAFTVYPLSFLFSHSRWKIPRRDQYVLWWGGLRGALAIALALSLPQEIPMHDQIAVAAFAAVAFSVLVQGLTIPLLLKR